MIIPVLVEAPSSRLLKIFTEVGERATSWEGRIKAKCEWEICKQGEVSCKSFLDAVVSHFRNIVGVNACLYMQLETGAVFSH